MSIKISLNTHDSEKKVIIEEKYKFERVPVIGEYISLPAKEEEKEIRIFKVVLVLHIPLPLISDKTSTREYDAKVYALKVNWEEAQTRNFYLS
ncbi:MAG TPA: hypothetical protein VIQ31_22815 [Phormidium sp.]